MVDFFVTTCVVTMNRIRYTTIMWKLMILAYSTVAHAQNGRRPEYDNGHGWDIRLAVPGKPGTDYPTLNSIPRTSFSCSGKSPGYYTDVEAGCQVFRVCTLGATYGFQSFLCPNGTLFNQEVLVCDWWMSVRCERSRLLFNDNSNKFGNLKLGPELMKDIKKMLTHPMRNPYDKTVMKSNLIVMQDYKPPSGQIFPNGALISGPERPPSNVYVPAKQRQGNFAQNVIQDLSFAASTPSSQYIPSQFIRPTASRDIEFLQPKRQNLQFVQNSHLDTTSQRQAGRLAQVKNTDYVNNNRLIQYSNTAVQHQRTIPQTQYTQNIHNSQSQHQQPQTGKEKSSNLIKKQQEFGYDNANPQYGYNSKQNGQLSSRIVNSYISREPKQDLGNSYVVPPTGKTLKFSRIVQKSSTGNPKSKVIFKTWIVRPAKTAQLKSTPTSYTYNTSSNVLSSNENRLVDTTTTPQSEKNNPESEDVPYIYNRPELSSKQIITTEENAPPIYLPPTAPTFSNRIYSTLKTQSSKESRPYIAPTTYKPLSKLYVPPSANTLELSRQYLNPHLSSENSAQESARLVAKPTSSAFDFTTTIPENKANPTFSLTKQSLINTNQNNLTFSDILTKEKLDITVSDIVKDTNKLLKSVPPQLLQQYRQNEDVVHNARKNYVPPEFENVSDEKLVAQLPNPTIKSEKIIATPSIILEPPIDFSFENHEISNKLSSLPYFHEAIVPTNTIERTVSLKITIPETIAEYLFNNQNENDAENLEILNTGSSNYLVLSNNNELENNDVGLIPIAKLIWDKNSNISNSQAFAYSLLADSINAAKQYSNIAKQNVISSIPTQSQFRNINNENLEDITNKISQLTSNHYANSNQNNANTAQTQKALKRDQETNNSKYTTGQSQQYLTLSRQEHNSQPQNLPNKLYSSRLQTPSNNNLLENLQTSNQIYSGQLYKLPVPEVTREIYNSPSPRQTSDDRLTNDMAENYSQHDVTPQNSSNNDKPNTDVEIVQSEAVPYPPARQQLPRTDESIFNSHEKSGNIVVNNFLNPDTGITAQVQDNIIGTLPHPLEENKLVTYTKNKSYYLYTKVEDSNDDNSHTTNTINQSGNQNTPHNSKLTRSNDQNNRVTFELFPSIGYELEDEKEKQILLNALKINEFNHDNHQDKISNHNQNQELVSGIDFTILHPTSKKQTEFLNNDNTLLYRGPSSYFAPQSSVGSLERSSQLKSYSNSRIEQFEDNNSNGYSKIIPARQFSF